MKYRIKATKEIVELRTWKRDDGAIKLVDKYGKMGFWPDEVEPAEQLDWHPASELPKKPTSKLGRIVILTLDGKLNFNYYVDGWDMSNVKWWCYPPKEE